MAKNKAPAGVKGVDPFSEHKGRPKGSRTKVQVPKQLLDMRYVYRTEKAGGEHPNDTSGQAIARKLCRESPQQFLVLLHKMESEHKAALERNKKVEDENKAGPSEGTKEIVDVIDRLLTEFEDTNGRP